MKKNSFSLWVLAVWILVVANGRNVVRGAVTPAKQKQALIDLYDSTNGPVWFKKDSWLTGDPCDDGWYGVSCFTRIVNDTNTFFVEELSLSENGLDGTLPDSLEDLKFLWELYMEDNALSGTIPPLDEDFEYLYVVDLGNNLLEGTIPNSLLTLESMKTLKLGNNSLEGTIPEFVSQTLNHIEMFANALVGTIPSLANSSLSYLDLYANQISGTIPAELGEMDQLFYLNLSYNVLTGSIPPFTQPTLGYLLLNSNQLSGTLQSDFSNVAELRLDHNSLTGSIPELKGNTRIFQLYLNNNNFNGTIPDYGAVSGWSFASFDLSHNNLTGKLPSTPIPTNLMYVQSNRLTGKIPHWLCDLFAFDISDNKFDCHRSDGPMCCRKGEADFNDFNCGECQYSKTVWWAWVLLVLGFLLASILCYLPFAYRFKSFPFHYRKSEYISISS